jgi:hypothetical protein
MKSVPQPQPKFQPSKELLDNFEQIKTIYQNYLKAKKSFDETSLILNNKKEEFKQLAIEFLKNEVPQDKVLTFQFYQQETISLEIGLRSKTRMEYLP